MGKIFFIEEQIPLRREAECKMVELLPLEMYPSTLTTDMDQAKVPQFTDDNLFYPHLGE